MGRAVQVDWHQMECHGVSRRSKSIFDPRKGLWGYRVQVVQRASSLWVAAARATIRISLVHLLTCGAVR